MFSPVEIQIDLSVIFSHNELLRKTFGFLRESRGRPSNYKMGAVKPLQKSNSMQKGDERNLSDGVLVESVLA